MKQLSQLAVILALPNEQVAEGIKNALRNVGCTKVTHCPDSKETMAAMAANRSYDIFFISDNLEPHGGVDFTRFIRLTNTTMSKADIILHMPGDVTRDKVIAARNAGVSAIMIGDITGASVLKQIEQVVANPKLFITCNTYTGPDRRRVNPPAYTGPERRKN